MSTWKQRYCVLDSTKMWIYKHKQDHVLLEYTGIIQESYGEQKNIYEEMSYLLASICSCKLVV